MEARETAEYMVMQCMNCGMLNVVHRNFVDGSICRDCAGAMKPMGYAILHRHRPQDIQVRVNVDTSDLDKIQRIVNEIDESVSGMIKRLTGVKEGLMQNNRDKNYTPPV